MVGESPPLTSEIHDLMLKLNFGDEGFLFFFVFIFFGGVFCVVFGITFLFFVFCFFRDNPAQIIQMLRLQFRKRSVGVPCKVPVLLLLLRLLLLLSSLSSSLLGMYYL